MDINQSRNMLSGFILDARNSLRSGQNMTVSIPIYYEDISFEMLEVATETNYVLTPSQIRSLLPFVLRAMDEGNRELLRSLYFSAFFMKVNYQFYASVSAETIARWPFASSYLAECRQNWVADTLSAMNRFEHGWAYEWVYYILQECDNGFVIEHRDDLIMLCRLLGMALGKPEIDCPSF